MEKELVKVGMKVKVSDSVFARMGANMAINVFIVGECHNEYFFGLKAYGNDNNFMAHCADFEPYEEPKEGLKKCHPIPNPYPDVGSIKTDEQIKRDAEYINAFKSYLDENANENYKSPQEIQEYFDNYFKELYGDKGEPITERIYGWFIPQGNPLAPPSVKFPNDDPKAIVSGMGNLYRTTTTKGLDEYIEKHTYQVKDLEGNVIEEKVVEDKSELIKPTIQKLDDGGYMIDLDKLDKGTYTPNELLEIIYEALQVSENLPITQEFIESFGFVGRKRATSGVHYKKGETLSLHHSGDNDYTLFFFENGFQDIVFDRYKCTTQSELRLLLTKGRIDCSK